MPKKKTPRDDQRTLPFYDELLSDAPPKQKNRIKKEPLLTVEEKRQWLAAILRESSGEFQGYEISLNDKFKALIEDSKLALPEHDSSSEDHTQTLQIATQAALSQLLHGLLDTITPPQQQRFPYTGNSYSGSSEIPPQ